ncbi:MAG: dockerin type I domain-containing protein [Candidatus Marinimicrobia bacterium]|nr:dockerin type I domain-containing protein [Candidatus Neomarinimicrobiota bacterium]
MLGDINGDSTLNILDLVSLVNLVLSNEYINTGDLNEDGTLNILDVVLLSNLILNDEQ